MSSSFLKSVKFSRKGAVLKGSDKIYFSTPNDQANSITLICGRNRTGKSYILRKIHQCLEIHNKNFLNKTVFAGNQIENEDIKIELNDSHIPTNAFFVNKVYDIIKYSKVISIELDTRFKERGPRGSRVFYDNPIQIKISLDNFVKDLIVSKSDTFEDNKWDKENDYRKAIVSKVFEKNKLYKADEANEVNKLICKATGGQIYVGLNAISEKISFVLFLYYESDKVISYENWSEGQKVLFVSLLIIKYIKPDILLFDEIENHLHPEFISLLLEYIKSKVPQTIITSHHPHIVFSNFVDKVWYMEVHNAQVEFPDFVWRKTRDLNTSIAPNRESFELTKNYHKISKVYNLFDTLDNNLIKLSSTTISDFNDFISDIFTSIYHYEIIPSNKSKKSDLQVEGLLKNINDKIERKQKIKVLEIGSGKGRIMIDIGKSKEVRYSKYVHWTLFEPIAPVYTELKVNIREALAEIQTDDFQYNIEVINTLSLEEKYDIIFFANVVHEITPNIIANYFSIIPKILNRDGEVIIIELYPLLKPEYFSLPYKKIDIENLFRKLFWNAVSENFNFKNSKIEAYWTILTLRDNTLVDENTLLKEIENFWKNDILLNRCADYAGRSEFKSADETILIMCLLTSIASINSYFSHQWALNITPGLDSGSTNRTDETI